MDASMLSSLFTRKGATLLAASSLVFAGSAFAANTNMDQARAEYEAQRAACQSGQSHQDRATCMREAGAAYEEARRGRLVRGTADYDSNARARCERHTGERREECLLLQGQDAKVYGSVEGGGTLREVTVRRVGEPPVPPERGVVTTPYNVHPGAVPQTMPQGGQYAPARQPMPAPGAYPGTTSAPGTYPGTTPAPAGTGLR